MSEEEREVALDLSVLEWFDPDLCAGLVGEHAAPVVRQLLGRGMFLSVVDPRVGAMRFHDLFRELMEMELAWRDPARRLDLHRRAAILWRSRGDLMSAYHHLSVIGETAKAKDLLVGPALALVDAGDLDALQRFAPQLPAPQLVTNAQLALDLAVVSLYASGTLAARRGATVPRSLIGAGADRRRPTDVDDERAAAARPGLCDRPARGRPRRRPGRHRAAQRGWRQRLPACSRSASRSSPPGPCWRRAGAVRPTSGSRSPRRSTVRRS